MVGEQGWTSRVFCIAQMSTPADLQGNPRGRTACSIESPTSSAGCSATITDYLTCLSSYFERVLCIGFEAASACNETPISAKSNANAVLDFHNGRTAVLSASAVSSFTASSHKSRSVFGDVVWRGQIGAGPVNLPSEGDWPYYRKLRGLYRLRQQQPHNLENNRKAQRRRLLEAFI